MRILLVKTSSLGDVIHALPVAADIAANVPDATIDWVVEEAFAGIPAMSPHVARILPVAMRRWRKSWRSREARRQFQAFRQGLKDGRYDRVIDLQGLVKSAFLARAAGIRIDGYDRRSIREPLASLFYGRRHAVSRALPAIARNRTLAALSLGYAVAGPPRFDLSVAAAAPIAPPSPYAVLVTGASRPTKIWDEANWLAVGADLAARGTTSVLTWASPDEKARCERLAAAIPGAVVAPRMTLAEVAALIGRAALVVGLDSGITHLAGALARPTIGLYCDYDPRLVPVTGEAFTASLGGATTPPSPESVIEAIGRAAGA